MTSAVVTPWPSWKRRPGRRVKRQVSRSGEMLQLSAICGFGSSTASQANSDS